MSPGSLVEQSWRSLCQSRHCSAVRLSDPFRWPVIPSTGSRSSEHGSTGPSTATSVSGSAPASTAPASPGCCGSMTWRVPSFESLLQANSHANPSAIESVLLLFSSMRVQVTCLPPLEFGIEKAPSLTFRVNRPRRRARARPPASLPNPHSRWKSSREPTSPRSPATSTAPGHGLSADRANATEGSQAEPAGSNSLRSGPTARQSRPTRPSWLAASWDHGIDRS